MKNIFLLTVALGSSLALAQAIRPTTRDLTNTERKVALTALCESKINLTDATCFPKKSFYTTVQRSPKSQLDMMIVGVQGAFTKAGSKQLLVSASFRDAKGQIDPTVLGVSIILENNKVVRQVQDGGSRTCFPFARGDGRDGLVCEREVTTPGKFESDLVWNDIGTGAKPQNLLFFSNNTIGGCSNPVKVAMMGGIPERKDMNNDKKPDLIIPVAYFTAPNPNCDVDINKMTPQETKTVFLWDGKAFKPDAATVKLIEEIGLKR